MKKWFSRLKRKFWLLKEKILSWLRKVGIMTKLDYYVPFKAIDQSTSRKILIPLVIRASSRQSLTSCIFMFQNSLLKSEYFPDGYDVFPILDSETHQKRLKSDLAKGKQIDIVVELARNILTDIEQKENFNLFEEIELRTSAFTVQNPERREIKIIYLKENKKPVIETYQVIIVQ